MNCALALYILPEDKAVKPGPITDKKGIKPVKKKNEINNVKIFAILNPMPKSYVIC